MGMVVRFRDPAGVARAVASEVVEASFRAIREHGDFHLVLAGGSTPRATYALLASEFRDEVDWRRVTLFFGDERCVPPTDPRSNHLMVQETLFEPLHIPSSSVWRMAGELEPEAAAMDYDARLRRLQAERNPMFDLVLLGMGPEGHTASIFPDSPALTAGNRLAMAVTVPAEPSERITMTPRALASTRQMLFVVTGAEKAPALARVFSDPDEIPAALVSAMAPSRLFVDEAAAAKLPS
jgi:6-phosphogluconolactonase